MRGRSFALVTRPIALVALLAALAASADPVSAQSTDSLGVSSKTPGVPADTLLGVPADTLFKATTTTFTNYDTSYDRDISSGTWNQAMSYTRSTKTLALSASGNFTTVDYTALQGLRSGTGGFDGQIAYRATPAWTINLSGRYNKASSHDLISQATIRGNRLNANMTYVLVPVKPLVLRAMLSSEFQQDNTLNRRPLNKAMPILGALGETLRVDTLFAQRDSTVMSGRQDGASLVATWKPRSWLNATTQANGTRVMPVTKSYLRDFRRDPAGAVSENLDYLRVESPNAFENYQSLVNFTGIPRTLAWLNLGTTNRTQQYFEKQLRGQEHLTLHQRTATFHVEHAPIPGGQVMVEGHLDRAVNEYALRTNRSSLVTGRTLQSSASYAPTPRTRFGGNLDIEYHKNERQVVQNGLNLFRILQLNAAHGVSPRLVLDAVTTISLLSFRYVDPTGDRDNQMTYFNGGGTYQVSPRCATQVHFSRNQAHAVAIDPSQSGNNNIQTSYQMNAALQLTANPHLKITQSYVLNAIYQIYDAPAPESKNTLNRIRRIDTVAWDSLFSFATIQFVHNFLFRDSGTYTRPDPDHAREYGVGSETYQQTVGLSLSLRPMTGIQVSLAQSLGNTVTNYLATRSRAVQNRWTLEVGGQVDRPLGEAGTLTGSVRRIDAYTERVKPIDELNDLEYWIANITLHKEFR